MSTVSQPETSPPPPEAAEPRPPASEQPKTPAAPASKTLRMSGELAGRLLSSSRWLR